MMISKLGFTSIKKEDEKIIHQLENVLQQSETDMTIFFRELSSIKKNHSAGCAISVVNNAFYNPKEINKKNLKNWEKWFEKYINRLNLEDDTDDIRKSRMDKVNPKYVLRNYMAQLAIDTAENEDYSIINELYELLKKPYSEQPDLEKWYAKRPDWAREKIGCSMLSCSS